jgi:hypothetical protein
LVARCIMGSVLIRATKEVLQIFRAAFPEGGPSSQLRSHLVRDPKRVRVRAVAIRRFRVLATLPVVFTSSVFVCSIASLCLCCLLPPLAPMRVVERIVDLPADP